MNDQIKAAAREGSGQARPPALENVQFGHPGLAMSGCRLPFTWRVTSPFLALTSIRPASASLPAAATAPARSPTRNSPPARTISFTADIEALRDCNFYIVTVPTPIDQAKRPDLTALMRASETVGRVLLRLATWWSTNDGLSWRHGRGLRAEILAKASGLTFNRDFFVGYSPERINPGDLQHRLPTIVKVTSGSTPDAADLVDKVYASVVTAGTHKVSSVRVAEAAKVIENIQRDVNIALINELAMLFKDLGLDTAEACPPPAPNGIFTLIVWPRRRPLHRRRSLYPTPQGAIDRLSPGDDPCRAPHQ